MHFLLRDLSGRGTTYVGDRQVTDGVEIRCHALLRFGPVDAVFLCEEPGEGKALGQVEQRAARRLFKMQRITQTEYREAMRRVRENPALSVAELLLMKTRLLVSEWTEAAADTSVGPRLPTAWIVAIATVIAVAAALWFALR